MSSEVILDTAVVQGVWIGGPSTHWLAQVVSEDVQAAVSAASYAELVRRAPDRRAEIQLMALMGLVNVLELTAETARRAGQIARDLDSSDPEAMLGAVVAATALETGMAVACVDDEFYSAMGCRIAEVG